MDISGILLLDKEFGLTSFEAVSRVKKILGCKKVGHAGTLDPYATGLLIVTAGKATKIAGYLSQRDKTYLARIRLGQCRDTYDRFGRITAESDKMVDEHLTRAALKEFKGDFRQIIPPYSAARFQGERLYELARKGLKTPERYKNVKIYGIELLEFIYPYVMLEIRCSSGTYVRSLAHQLGEKLGCGAHLYSLVRTSIGACNLEGALTLLQLEALIRLGLFDEYLISMESALKIPALIVIDSKIGGIKNGREVLPEDIFVDEIKFEKGELVGLMDSSGNFLAIGRACVSSGEIFDPAQGRRKIFDYERVF